MKFRSAVFALIATISLIGFAQAQSESKQSEAQPAAEMAKKEMVEKTECKEGVCPIATAMKELPQMTYKIGEESTCCSKSAAKLAEQHNLPIHYVVGKKTYEQKDEAYTSLVTETETFVNDFITPCKCETSGSTKIAGESCQCSVMAGEKAELVKSAVEKVNMSYLVGEKTCSCPHEADALAKSSEAEKQFVVGEEKTCCEKTARLNLARAKYKAAVEALAAKSTDATPKAVEKAGS